MKIATTEDVERYKAEAENFFNKPWITMFNSYQAQFFLLMEYLASKENKTIYQSHFEKFKKLNP